jgi:hypothetical protein
MAKLNNLITAEKLKNTIRACSGGAVFFAAEGYAVELPKGWILRVGSFVLRSARIREPRYFSSIDSLVNIARECGLDQVTVQVERMDEKDAQLQIFNQYNQDIWDSFPSRKTAQKASEHEAQEWEKIVKAHPEINWDSLPKVKRETGT